LKSEHTCAGQDDVHETLIPSLILGNASMNCSLLGMYFLRFKSSFSSCDKHSSGGLSSDHVGSRTELFLCPLLLFSSLFFSST